MAKFTILQATPYPEEASSPNLFTNAQSARKDIWVRNSWRARGSPIPRNRLHGELKRKSDFLMEKGSFFFSRMTIAHTTLTSTRRNGCERLHRRHPDEALQPEINLRKYLQYRLPEQIKRRFTSSPSPRKIATSRLQSNNEEIPLPTDSYIACGK